MIHQSTNLKRSRQT